ncbi:unnamed protein product [Symbiodinium natans]|uniref:Uncharacterized protein n=1 Tax=Symbiodinium natans TaxID=878477 RepID=A0A812T7A6_9DINO|nr:unnamed protein product [Symbiodinium natans]
MSTWGRRFPDFILTSLRSGTDPQALVVFGWERHGPPCSGNQPRRQHILLVKESFREDGAVIPYCCWPVPCKHKPCQCQDRGTLLWDQQLLPKQFRAVPGLRMPVTSNATGCAFRHVIDFKRSSLTSRAPKYSKSHLDSATPDLLEYQHAKQKTPRQITYSEKSVGLQNGFKSCCCRRGRGSARA